VTPLCALQKQLCELKEKNERLEEEVAELQKRSHATAEKKTNSISAVMEGLDGATKKHAERIKALEGDLDSTRLQLAAEANARQEAERELKKLKGETEPSTRRSNRARRGALEPVKAVPSASNVQAVEEAPAKAEAAQKENAGAAMPVRRSLRQQKAAVVATGADPAAAGQDAENCKQQ
jgi:predicted RNase H-like nuclease (RuvC/YqgF family)